MKLPCGCEILEDVDGVKSVIVCINENEDQWFLDIRSWQDYHREVRKRVDSSWKYFDENHLDQ